MRRDWSQLDTRNGLMTMMSNAGWSEDKIMNRETQHSDNIQRVQMREKWKECWCPKTNEYCGTKHEVLGMEAGKPCTATGLHLTKKEVAIIRRIFI